MERIIACIQGESGKCVFCTSVCVCVVTYQSPWKRKMFDYLEFFLYSTMRNIYFFLG